MSIHCFISVIVPVYNGEKYIRKCLESLFNQSYPQDCYEVIVVDNDSSDNTIEIAKSFNVKILSEKKRSSYSARNKGIRHAKGSVIAFTDVDCIAESTWLEKGAESYMNTRHDLKIVSGRVQFFSVGRMKTWGYYDINTYLNQEAAFKLGKAITANVFVSREVFNVVGLFDKELRSGGDGEWTARAVKAGFPVVYKPDVVVLHPTRNTFKEISMKTLRIGFGAGQVSAKKGDRLYLIRWRHQMPPLRKFYMLVMTDQSLQYKLIFLIKMLWSTTLLQVILNAGKWYGYISSVLKKIFGRKNKGNGKDVL